MTNILYIGNNRIPTEKAHGLQICKTCDAFTQAGATTRLVIPQRKQSDAMKGVSAKQYYQLSSPLSITRLRVIDLLMTFPKAPDFLKILFYYLLVISFSLRTLFFTARFNKKAVIYSRDISVLFLITLFLRRRCFYEGHNFPKTRIGRFLYRSTLTRSSGVVVITHALKKLYTETFGIDAKKIFVAPDGVDIAHQKTLSVDIARKKHDLPLNKKIVLYTGNVYKWKGVYTFVDAAKKLPDTAFVIVGGDKYDGDFEKLSTYCKKQRTSNVILTGHKPYSLISEFLATADMVVLPTSAKEAIGKLYTSPLKAFEYMQSGKPIISSDVPSSREIFDDTTAFFFEPDNAESLAASVNEVLSHPKKASLKAVAAKKAAKKYSWKNRGKTILSHIAKSTP